MHGACNQTVTLHLAQSLREHLLAYSLDRFAEPSESQFSFFTQDFKDQHRPFVSHAANQIVYKGFNPGIEIVWGCAGGVNLCQLDLLCSEPRLLGHFDTLFLVSIKLSSAYFHWRVNRVGYKEQVRWTRLQEVRMKLENKTVLITGGTSGIGLELAKQLLQMGNTVIVTGRDREKLNAAKRCLSSIHIFASDVSDPAAIVRLHESVLAQFPALDTLINNAGIMRNLDLNQERTLEDVTREIEINLSGPVRMIQQFLPHLKTRESALIVNISSGVAFIPLPISPVYSATKAALHSFTQSLRVQLDGTGLRVVELAPPGTETPLFRGEFEAEMKGQKGMDVTVLAGRAIAGIEAGKLEIRPGLANVLRAMSRIAPQFMLKQMAKMSKPKNGPTNVAPPSVKDSRPRDSPA